jgi:hypothetical protein
MTPSAEISQDTDLLRLDEEHTPCVQDAKFLEKTLGAKKVALLGNVDRLVPGIVLNNS